MNIRRLFLTSSALIALSALGIQAHAASWPTQPLRIVVPFAAGGTSDVIARLMSKPLSDALGVPVLIDNRTGAAGNIGAAYVANATDNHTVLLTDLGSLAISPLVTKDLPFKPSDLQGVAMLAYSPHLLVAHPGVAANNLKELVALSKTTKINVASSGTGTPNHLGIVEIALETGMKWQHVPYRGGAQSLNDTAAGTTQIVLNGMLATMPLVQGGRLKVIGISRATRMPLVSHIPTIAEQGVKNFESGTYQGVTASSKMSRQAIERLNTEMIRIIRSPELRARLLQAGAEVMTSTPIETTNFIAKDRLRWANVIQRAGTELEGTQ